MTVLPINRFVVQSGFSIGRQLRLIEDSPGITLVTTGGDGCMYEAEWIARDSILLRDRRGLNCGLVRVGVLWQVKLAYLMFAKWLSK